VCEILETEKKSIEADENTLRNKFLEGLKLRFESSATAETFRRNGLTDILAVNPKNPNEEIVTEVKIWKGPKYYQKACMQAKKGIKQHASSSEMKVHLVPRRGWGPAGVCLARQPRQAGVGEPMEPEAPQG